MIQMPWLPVTIKRHATPPRSPKKAGIVRVSKTDPVFDAVVRGPLRTAGFGGLLVCQPASLPDALKSSACFRQRSKHHRSGTLEHLAYIQF
jgi:hypothetical protein